jgi:ATP phosphoribosyltransferase
MSEAIVDLVATGNTLRENGLVEIETLFYTTARLVANPLLYRLNADGVGDYVDRIREIVG